MKQSLFQECFAAFCSGLASNTGLELLDLRNNQLTHQVSHKYWQTHFDNLDKYIFLKLLVFCMLWVISFLGALRYGLEAVYPDKPASLIIRLLCGLLQNHTYKVAQAVISLSSALRLNTTLKLLGKWINCMASFYNWMNIEQCYQIIWANRVLLQKLAKV